MKKIIKVDTEENWKKAINFIPKSREIIAYEYNDEIRFKIGNGVNNVNDLPFTDERISFQVLDGDFITDN